MFTTFLLCAVPLFVLGFLIRERKKLHLVTGIDLDRVSDLGGLADWLGLTCYRLGALTTFAGLGLALAPVYALPVLVAYSIATLVAAGLLLRGISRFQRPQISV